MKLTNKNILLGITGSIAAYKSADLTRKLIAEGATVRVIMTNAAKKFISPLTLQTLSCNPVYEDLFTLRDNTIVEHIELAKWADAILIAPATANILAKLANGYADDLLSSVCLATTSTIAIAPAMNQAMWENNVTQQNVQALKERNIYFFGPENGLQACGDNGSGRMIAVEEITNLTIELFSSNILTGKKVLITAGPTVEPIDPVRYLSNHSSGKMGFALAQAAMEAGAKVTLISGPVSIKTTNHINRINVTTAQEMFDAVMPLIKDTDIFIATAAVADYRPEKTYLDKIKRDDDTLELKLTKNPDVLASAAGLPNRPYLVGFAAETENLIENAKQKLANKNLDMIAANLVHIPNQGFNSNNNALTILFKDKQIELSLNRKNHLARELIKLIAEQQPIS